MTLIIYPHTRIITYEELKGYPLHWIQTFLHGEESVFHYQAGFPQKKFSVIGERNEPIVALVNKLSQDVEKWEIIQARKIGIVQHYSDYRNLFSPRATQIGEIVDLSNEEYTLFVDEINALRREQCRFQSR